MSRLATTLLALALLVLAVGLVWFSMENGVEEESQPSQAKVDLQPSRRPIARAPTDEASGTARMPEVIRLSPADWKRLFATDYKDVPEENQTEILDLAAELDHALSTGGRPDSEDAKVYTDAILSLLNEPVEEPK